MKHAFTTFLGLALIGAATCSAGQAVKTHRSATAHSKNPPPLITGGESNWEYIPRTDKMTDEHSDVFDTTALDGRHKETLFIRCKKDQIDVYIATDSVPALPPDSTFGTEVQLRYDHLPAFEELWLRSDDGHGLMSQTGGSLLAHLLQYSTFLVRWTPVDESPQVVTFQMSDLGIELTRHRACQQLFAGPTIEGTR